MKDDMSGAILKKEPEWPFQKHCSACLVFLYILNWIKPTSQEVSKNKNILSVRIDGWKRTLPMTESLSINEVQNLILLYPAPINSSLIQLTSSSSLFSCKNPEPLSCSGGGGGGCGGDTIWASAWICFPQIAILLDPK